MRPIKPWKELSFTDDYMFKKTMEAKIICRGTLNRILPWNIRRITYFEEEKPLQALYEIVRYSTTWMEKSVMILSSSTSRNASMP